MSFVLKIIILFVRKNAEHLFFPSFILVCNECHIQSRTLTESTTGAQFLKYVPLPHS